MDAHGDRVLGHHGLTGFGAQSIYGAAGIQGWMVAMGSLGVVLVGLVVAMDVWWCATRVDG